ncbi:MAG: carbohydrate ABC transporter permease [bacterium]|nr:carbohydrate ABC transporter permease [bacterium]
MNREAVIRTHPIPTVHETNRTFPLEHSAPRRPNRWLTRYGLSLVLIVVCVVLMFPIVYTLITSLQPRGYGQSRELFQQGIYLGHYEQLFATPRFVRNLVNSTVMSLGGALVTTTLCALAGYAFARQRFAGRRWLLIGMLGLIMLPGIVNLIPLYRLSSEILRAVPNNITVIADLSGRQAVNALIVIGVYGAFGIPFGVWVMKGFFDSIPRELEEAAFVDGASVMQALWRVILPISLPGLVAVFLTNFVFNWNDFLTASVLIRTDELKTATVGLLDFQNQLTGNNSEMLNAASILIMLPGIAIFLLARGAFFRGYIDGAVKG